MSDSKSPDGAHRVTERRCKLNVEAPYLLKKIIGVDFVYFIQKNMLDFRNRTLNIEAYNESFSSRVIVMERCKYYVHPENSDWTCFEQSATLDIRSFFGFENSMEKLAMKQYSQNIAKGKEIIEYFVNELKKEGVTYLPAWSEPEKADPDENDDDDELLEDQGDTSQSSGEFALGASASDYSTSATASKTTPQLSSESQFQLDTDYIQRYLGELSLMQESRLVQLRKWVADLQKGKALLRIIEIVEANYPETMGRVLIIRAPRVFPILWTLVSTFIDENTRSKFLFYGGNDYQANGGLVDYIPEEYLPDFLGGPCREGGLVPKGLYMTEGDLEREGCPLTEDSIYHSVSLGRGQVHEVLVTNDDPGSVITWDFDVMKQDVMFTVYRTRVPVPAQSPSGRLHLP
ncbi:SEC14-like protein 1 [Blattella germanica]|nr:SEC14-like protein 1 [Blattella germanica]